MCTEHVERTGESIRVDVLVQSVPPQAQLVAYVIACLIGPAFFGALAWQSALDAWQSTLRQETIMSNFLFEISGQPMGAADGSSSWPC